MTARTPVVFCFFVEALSCPCGSPKLQPTVKSKDFHVFFGSVLQSSIRVMHQARFWLSSLDGLFQRPERRRNWMSRSQIAFNSGDLAFQEIIMSRPAVTAQQDWFSRTPFPDSFRFADHSSRIFGSAVTRMSTPFRCGRKLLIAGYSNLMGVRQLQEPPRGSLDLGGSCSVSLLWAHDRISTSLQSTTISIGTRQHLSR
jgi:hypothetical protein